MLEAPRLQETYAELRERTHREDTRMKVPTRDLAGLSLGIELVVSIVLMSAIGRWADRHWGTEPTLTMVGFLLGAASGFRSMYRYASRMGQDSAETPKPPETPKEPPEKPSP